MKKLVIVLISALVAAFLLTAGVCAATVSSGYAGPGVTYVLDDTYTITFSGEGYIDDYTFHGPGWQSYMGKITKAVICDGVTGIGGYALDGASSLTEVVIPESVTTIGDWAFGVCTSLKEITLPSRLYSIGSRAFGRCEALCDITVLSKDVTYGESAFWYANSALTFHGFSGSTTEAYAAENSFGFAAIDSGDEPVGGMCGDSLAWSLPEAGELVISGTGAMWEHASSADVPWRAYLPEIKAVTVCEGATSVADYSFIYAEALCEVSLPESLTSIGKSAFLGCTAIEGISIPKNVASIGENALYGCDSLANITVDADNGVYASDESGVLYNKAMTTVLLYPIGSAAVSYTMPDTVTFVEAYAFFGASKLENITFSKNLEGFGDLAFALCTSLREVALDCPLTETAQNVFAGCSALTSISLSEKIDTVGYGMFSECISLENVVIPDTVTTIKEGAFYACTGLKTVDLGGGVTTVEGYVFENCTALTGIVIPDNVTSIGQSAFYGCSSLASVTVGKGLSAIAMHTFNSCKALERVEIPENIKTVEMWSFGNCSNLTDVYVYASDAAFGNRCFANAHADFTLHGYKDSTAETYATNNGHAFKELSAAVTVIGDADGDGKTNAIDLAYLQRHLAGWTGYGEDKVNLAALDLNSDGKVNPMDAAVLARHLANWIGYETIPLK